MTDRERALQRGVASSQPYSDEQWRDIKNCLVKAGVPDATLSGGFRRQLDLLASIFACKSRQKYVRKASPLALQARELRKEIIDLETALKVLGRIETSYGLASADCHLVGMPESKRLRAVESFKLAQAQLFERQARMQLRLKSFASPAKRPTQTNRRETSNAKQVYTDYWRALARLWQEIVPNASILRHRHFHLQNFLRVCSKSVFPTATTDTALVAFTERHFPAPRNHS